MKLAKTARKFDNLVVADVYNPTAQFKAQLLDSSPTLRDAITNERRTLSIDPILAVPARRTVEFDGSIWIVGAENKDYYRGKPIRNEILLSQVDGPARVITIKQALQPDTGLETYAMRAWVKTVSEIETNSVTPNKYDIYFQIGEQIAVGSFVYLMDTWHIIRSIHTTSSRYKVAVTEELNNDLIVTAEYNKRVFAPIADEWVDEHVGAIPGVAVRWQNHYYYSTQADTKFNLGDIVLQVLKTDMPDPAIGQHITIPKNAIAFPSRSPNVEFRIVDIFDEGDTWAFHLSVD